MSPKHFFFREGKGRREAAGKIARNDSEVAAACARNHSDTKTGICLAHTLDRRFELIKEICERLLATCKSRLQSENVI